MKFTKNILKAGAMLTLTLIIFLTACGTSADETAEPEPEEETIEEIDTFSLIGTWRSKPNDSGTYYEAVISNDDEIIMYQYTNDACSVYWAGTFISDPEEERNINIESSRDEDADTISEDETKLFTYHSNDETLYFSSENEEGTSIGVYMTRILNDYYMNYKPVKAEEPVETSVDKDDATEPAEADIDNADNTQNDTSDIPKTDEGTETTDNNNDTAQGDSGSDNATEKETDVTEPAKETTGTNVGTESKPAYTYTDKSATMYTTIGLNVRSGPMTNFGIIGSYEAGDTVKVTGACNETGWSRVDYNGTTGYVDSTYLTGTAPAKQNTASNTTTQNTAQTTVQTTTQTETYVSGGFNLQDYPLFNGQYLGKLRVPSVGINVPIYNSNSQAVVDAENSAALYFTGTPSYKVNYTMICADHDSQGFSAIKNCTVGTALYIDCVDGNTYKYICDRVDYNGYNDGARIYDGNGNSITYTGGLYLQTCNDETGTSVTIVHFNAA